MAIDLARRRTGGDESTSVVVLWHPRPIAFMVVFMRVVLISAVALAILAVPARAQMQMGDKPAMDPLQLMYESERRERIEIEKKYNETVRHTETGAVKVKKDPWSGVRPGEATSKK
jgi:hypothetical protein